jgi:hypothetical protein
MRDVRPSRAALLVLTALLSAACTSEPGNGSPGVPPERVSAVAARCPDDHPVAVLGGVAFPPGHPDEPVLDPPPDRCFRSTAEAGAAGYTTADPPPGTRLIGDLYLSPTEAFEGDCRRAANAIDLPVICPTTLPAGGSLILEIERGTALFEGAFPLPPGHDPASGAHLWVITTRPELAPDVEGCSDVLRRSPARVRGRTGSLLECGEGSELHGGHVVLVWTERGGSHAVSLHGVTDLNRRVVRAIAESARLVD